MPATDANRYPQIYRAIWKPSWYDVKRRQVVATAFVLKLERGETAVSLLKEVGCSLVNCIGGFGTCFGEFMLPTQSIIDLGLQVVDDDLGEAGYQENHAQITGIPTGLTEDEDLRRENLYTALAELASLHYDRKGRFDAPPSVRT